MRDRRGKYLTIRITQKDKDVLISKAEKYRMSKTSLVINAIHQYTAKI